MILEKILRYKKKLVIQEKKETPMEALIAECKNSEEPRDFKKALGKEGKISIIGEIKKASPSKGIIRRDFDPVAIGRQYEKNGLDAISIITEDHFFSGNNAYIKKVKAVTTAPLLRKDFIVDPYQLYQSKALGADAVLLIAAALTQKELMDFQRSAKEMGLHCLVEVHNKEELERVLDTGTEIIGINNRDLATFETRLDTTKVLRNHIPKEKIVVSESGINTGLDMAYLQGLKVDAVLVGEGLMRAKSIEEKLQELGGVNHVKN